MNADLDDLTIHYREVEGLTGLEVNDMFMGGILGGTYRWSIFRQPKQLLFFWITQLIVSVLVFIFSLPFGLFLFRNSAQSVNDVTTIARFFQVTLGITVIFMLGWNIYLHIKARAWKTLAHLLAEVDKYNDVLQAMAILDQLETVRNRETTQSDRHQIIEALTVTRNSLISGLMTERILRENRKLLARRYDLFTNIEANLIALKTLEINNQANEYAELLTTALQIGISVQQEVKQLSNHQDY